MNSKIPKVVTKDRKQIFKIIEDMLENLDSSGLYPTTDTFSKLEQLMYTVRMEAAGWAWGEACLQLDQGKDPRKYEEDKLVERISKELNPEEK